MQKELLSTLFKDALPVKVSYKLKGVHLCRGPIKMLIIVNPIAKSVKRNISIVPSIKYEGSY